MRSSLVTYLCGSGVILLPIEIIDDIIIQSPP